MAPLAAECRSGLHRRAARGLLRSELVGLGRRHQQAVLKGDGRESHWLVHRMLELVFQRSVEQFGASTDIPRSSSRELSLTWHSWTRVRYCVSGCWNSCKDTNVYYKRAPHISERRTSGYLITTNLNCYTTTSGTNDNYIGSS